MQSKVSVIIPVFNAEPFLAECICSLTNQTLEECEFVFVNDGAFDGSRNIIEEFRKNDKRIILINQENKGQSSARNKGLGIATGKYIGFVDADDCVAINHFENLYNNAEQTNSDIVISDYFLGRDNKFILKQNSFSKDITVHADFIQDKIVPNLLEKEELFPVWNKLYSRSFIIDNNIHFPEDQTLEEDGVFNLKAFSLAHTAVFIYFAGYYYRETNSSVSRNIDKTDYFEVALQKLHYDYKKNLDLRISSEELKRLTAIRFVHRVFYLVYRYSKADVSFANKIKYIKNMVFHAEVVSLSERYKEDILREKGIYETCLLMVMRTKCVVCLHFIIAAIIIFYRKSFSELIRTINGNKTAK